MLAARDQENLVHGHHQAAAAKPLNQVSLLQPKTPGNKYPKTPLKIPLNDENGPAGLGGKSGKGKGVKNMTTFDNAFVTPIRTRTRAPLGMKTTNAKAKGFQTPGVGPEKGLEKTQAPKSTTRGAKKVTHGDTVKIQVHGDESPLREDREVEYAPPKPKDLPYESDDFPRDCLNFNALKPDNLMRGIYRTYHVAVDSNGLTAMDRKYEENRELSQKELERQVREMMKEEWTVGDVPETFQNIKKKLQKPATEPTVLKPRAASQPKAVGTIASRNAASALSVTSNVAPVPKRVVPKPTSSFQPPFLSRVKPTPAPANPSTMRHTAAAAASRSTIGYNKGRSAASVMNAFPAAPLIKRKEGPISRSASNLSHSSDSTMTPAKFASEKEEDWSHLKFLDAFDRDDAGFGSGGALPECMRGEEEEEEFLMTVPSRD
ncbi:hypothetical protein BJ878DRAFT_228297 [Calycina marina]|uniref:Uncharacterized protein n=1 Tax=Calycina marina TaxID=1763456 RepID=A0A9P7YYG7_9HELO|nr:hypothetical protein BJ878DRAFT_228297 [Calycina marina]